MTRSAIMLAATFPSPKLLRTEGSLSDLQAEDVERILTDYGAVLAEPSALGAIRDLRSLSNSKSAIKAALKVALSVATDPNTRDHLKVAYICLADFQPLTEEETRALRQWNGATTKPNLVLDVEKRIATEAEALREDLWAGGFW